MTQSLESLGTVFVVGARGMLAGHLIPKLARGQATLVLADRNETTFLAPRTNGFPSPELSGNLPYEDLPVSALDITDQKAVQEFVGQCRPQWILNCAAFTDVDGSEKNYRTAFEVNSYGAAHLARAARSVNSRMLHLSSDYVFGGTAAHPGQHHPYSEDDAPSPGSLYGESKRFGDELVREIMPEHSLILRTSWLHGLYGPSFVNSIIQAAAERPELKVVDDQRGCPTWADWLADVIVHMISSKASGIYNACSRDHTTWFEYAQFVVGQIGSRTPVLPQRSSELNRPAHRPSYSVLSVERLERFIGSDCIKWQTGVLEHLSALGLVQSDRRK